MAIPFHFDDKKTSFCLIMSDAGFAFPPQIRYYSSLFSRYVVCPPFRKVHYSGFDIQFLTTKKRRALHVFSYRYFFRMAITTSESLYVLALIFNV